MTEIRDLHHLLPDKHKMISETDTDDCDDVFAYPTTDGVVNDATEHERQTDHHDEIFILIRIIYFFEESSMSQKYNLHQ